MTPIDDVNIPVLTEIINPEPTDKPQTNDLSAISGSGIPGTVTDASHLFRPATQEANTASADTQMDWDAMELTVREAVLKQVLTRVDFVLEHRVRDGLADVLQTAVDKLADEIRTGLANSLGELVSRSVQQELVKLRSGKN